MSGLGTIEYNFEPLRASVFPSGYFIPSSSLHTLLVLIDPVLLVCFRDWLSVVQLIAIRAKCHVPLQISTLDLNATVYSLQQLRSVKRGWSLAFRNISC